MNFLKQLVLDLTLSKLNTDLLIKMQNFTLLSNFYGNLEKHINNNVRCNLYVRMTFNNLFVNNFYIIFI